MWGREKKVKLVYKNHGDVTTEPSTHWYFSFLACSLIFSFIQMDLDPQAIFPARFFWKSNWYSFKSRWATATEPKHTCTTKYAHLVARIKFIASITILHAHANMVIYLYICKAVLPFVLLLTVHKLEITSVFWKTMTIKNKSPSKQPNLSCSHSNIWCSVLILKQEHICSASFLKPERHMLRKVPVSMFQPSFYSLT